MSENKNTNREILENLRADMIGAFRTAAKDIQSFLDKPDEEWKIDDIPVRRYNNERGSVAVVVLPPNPNQNKEFAKAMRDKYSHGYTICASEDLLQEEGPAIADRLIAKWGDAQMLLIMPELVDEETPEIQSDIRDMLTRVRERLQVIQGPRDQKAQNRIADFFQSIKGMDVEDMNLMRLEAAEDILRAVHKEAKDMLFEKPSL
ncbi:MAG: hypothetical protein ACLFR0_05290 [Alphaproteobacteria bacterium]